MSLSSAMTERHGRTLAQLAEAGLASALDLQDRLLAAKTAAEAAQLAQAYAHVARAVRMSIALEAKLERQVALAEREAAREAAQVRAEQVERRCARVQVAVERACWDQVADDLEAERLADEVEERVDALRDEADILEGPIEAQIERLTLALGLKVGDEAETAKAAARDAREAADAAAEADDLPPDWTPARPRPFILADSS